MRTKEEIVKEREEVKGRDLLSEEKFYNYLEKLNSFIVEFRGFLDNKNTPKYLREKFKKGMEILDMGNYENGTTGFSLKDLERRKCEKYENEEEMSSFVFIEDLSTEYVFGAHIIGKLPKGRNEVVSHTRYLSREKLEKNVMAFCIKREFTFSGKE